MLLLRSNEIRIASVFVRGRGVKTLYPIVMKFCSGEDVADDMTNAKFCDHLVESFRGQWESNFPLFH